MAYVNKDIDIYPKLCYNKIWEKGGAAYELLDILTCI